MKIILLEGSTWPLLPLDEAERLKDIDDALEFGNHKGAVNQKELLLTLVNDDVVRGFALPLPLDNNSARGRSASCLSLPLTWGPRV